MTNQDAYVEGIAELYKVNIIPYMEAWGLKISDEAKAKVYENNYPVMNILKDMVNDNTLQSIINGEGMDRKYGLVSNEVLQKYTTQGDMNLQIEIDDMRQIQGKVIQIKDGKDIIKSIKIENNQIEETLPVGTYFLQMPVINGYSYQYAYVQIKEDMENPQTYVYEKLEDIDYENYLMFRVLGYNYDTIAYQLTFKEQYTKTEIRYPNKFTNKVVVYNTLTNTIIPEYKAIDTVTRYTIIENGIVREDMSEENAEDVVYAQLKVHLVGIIEAYKQKVTEEELQNKRINYEEKTQIIDAYNQLREQDKIPYTSLINKIKQGGIPKITVIAPTLEFEKGTPIDVYTFIKAVDNEDGEIVIDKTSTVVKTNLKNDEAGSYFVTYEVSDSDNNVATKTIEITIIADEEEVLPPQIDEENKEETVVLEKDENTGNTNNSSSGNQNIVDSSNDNQENIEEELESVEDTIEIASLEQTENMNEEDKEKEVIESIQGTYEDEFGENVEDINSNEVSQKGNNIMIKVFVTIIIVAGVTFGIARKKLKANKRF